MLCFWIPFHVKPENTEFALVCESISADYFSWKELSFSYLSCWMLQQTETELSVRLYSSTEAVPSYSLQLGNWHLMSLVLNIIISSAKWNCGFTLSNKTYFKLHKTVCNYTLCNKTFQITQNCFKYIQKEGKHFALLIGHKY